VEWRGVTGGQNGIMGIAPPQLFGAGLGERGMAIAALVGGAAGAVFFEGLLHTAFGQAVRAGRDLGGGGETAGPSPRRVKTAAFAISAALAGLAGALFAPLSGFVTPSTFAFSQSILFVLVVLIGGAGSTAGPVVGATIVVLLPELLAGLAEYRLLFF